MQIFSMWISLISDSDTTGAISKDDRLYLNITFYVVLKSNLFSKYSCSKVSYEQMLYLWWRVKGWVC